MAEDLPRSCSDQFEDSLRRLIASGGGGSDMLAPSLDTVISQFPLELDDRWGPGMHELHRAALRATVLRQSVFLTNDLEQASAMCESPPERAMLYALVIAACDWTDGVLLRLKHTASGYLATRGVYLTVEPQAEVDRYRVDFLLTMTYRKDEAITSSAKLVVECDGYDWHERTPEQARRDRERDRVLQANDLAVYRYMGSDIWRDVFGAAHEAIGELQRRFDA